MMEKEVTMHVSDSLTADELRQKGSLKGFEYQSPGRRTFLREVENRIRITIENFGFDEVEGPMLQPIEFYQVKSGDELLAHTYTFVDADKSILVLRPEMTPTVAFMVAKDEGELIFPLRWWSNPDLFRKEKPQKGRKRQFKQLNVDIFDRADSGRERSFDDAEVISVAISIFEKFGLGQDDIVMRINSRSLIEKVFTSINLDQPQRIKALALIDRKDKISEEVFASELESLISSSESRQVLSSWLSLKTIDQIPQVSAFKFLERSSEYLELVKVLELLKVYGKDSYCEFAPYIVRGLGYYTGTVFEAFDRKGEFKRSLMGGGRYDNLTKNLGGKIQITGVGFGFGNVPLEEILELRNINILETKNRLDYYVVVQSENNRFQAIDLSQRLRKSGLSVILDESISKDKPDKVNKQLSKANKLGVRTCIIVFPDELSRGQIIVKDMTSGKQETVEIDSLTKNA